MNSHIRYAHIRIWMGYLHPIMFYTKLLAPMNRNNIIAWLSSIMTSALILFCGYILGRVKHLSDRAVIALLILNNFMLSFIVCFRRGILVWQFGGKAYESIEVYIWHVWRDMWAYFATLQAAPPRKCSPLSAQGFFCHPRNNGTTISRPYEMWADVCFKFRLVSKGVERKICHNE